MTTSILDMPGLLPVTPTIKRGKPEIAISHISATTGPFSLIFSGIEALPLPFLICYFLLTLYPFLYFW
jgi:hypothetical protein